MRHHQLCKVLVGGSRIWLLWFADDDQSAGEGVLVQDGRVLCWRDEATARGFAAGRSLSIDEASVPEFDADRLLTLQPTGAFPDGDVLGLWNLFTDVAASLADEQFAAADQAASPLHARLSETSLQHLLGSSPPPLNSKEIAAVLDVVRRGREMLLTRHVVLE